MTFKHSKFEDSVTMRSLEKLAREKGWVKSEPPMTKSASSKSDLSPSGSLVENVLKLCEGLRTAGYEKYASELETKLVTYKQAQTLYETSKEKGEDLVHAAHPKGSHKLEDVEGDEAVFEDIIDKHLKHVEVVEKQPTGKLASSRDVISAVKVVLAQEGASIVNSKMDEAYKHLITIFNTVQSSATEEEAGAVAMGRTTSLMAAAKYLKARPVTATTIKYAQTALENARNTLQYVDPREREANPHKYTFSLSSYNAWLKIMPEFDAIKTILADATNLMKGGSDLMGEMDKLLTKLESYRNLLKDEGFTPDDRVEGNKEIDGYVKTLQNWKTILSGLDPDTRASESARYAEKLKGLNEQVAQLYKEIVG